MTRDPERLILPNENRWGVTVSLLLVMVFFGSPRAVDVEGAAERDDVQRDALTLLVTFLRNAPADARPEEGPCSGVVGSRLPGDKSS